jgi:hypothetical protein
MSVSMYMCVCMYVCIHACMYACMYVSMSVFMYVRMYVSMYVCTYVCTYVRTYVCTYLLVILPYGRQPLCAHSSATKLASLSTYASPQSCACSSPNKKQHKLYWRSCGQVKESHFSSYTCLAAFP